MNPAILVLETTVLTYAAVGLLFAGPFAAWGAGRTDPVARHGTWGFRILVIPGAAALWPLLAWLWVRASRGDSQQQVDARVAERRASGSQAGGATGDAPSPESGYARSTAEYRPAADERPESLSR